MRVYGGGGLTRTGALPKVAGGALPAVKKLYDTYNGLVSFIIDNKLHRDDAFMQQLGARKGRVRKGR